MTFHGTIAQLDALLNTDGTSAVSYIDTSAHPAASVQLSLSINDGGHTGTGGPLTDTATVAIAILGFADSAPGAFDFNFDNNGNGHADLLLQNGTSGAVSIWESGLPSGNSLVASSVPGWHLDGIGDFDGNGKARHSLGERQRLGRDLGQRRNRAHDRDGDAEQLASRRHRRFRRQRQE